MHHYDTVTEAIKNLTERGYTLNFNLRANQIYCADADHSLNAEEFEIDETYRFEGNTDPGDEMVVYGINAPHRGIKGILVNAFGPYSDTLSDELIAKLKASH